MLNIGLQPQTSVDEIVEIWLVVSENVRTSNRKRSHWLSTSGCIRNVMLKPLLLLGLTHYM